jgi:Tol biopolymer transport system component
MATAVPLWLFVGDPSSARNATHRAVSPDAADTVGVPTLARRQLLTQTGDAVRAAVSRDGRLIVVEVERGGRSSLWLHDLHTNTREELVPLAPVRYWEPTFSPDGETLFFLRANRADAGMALYRQALTAGAAPQRICEFPDLQGALAVSPDGRRVAVIRGSRERDDSLVLLVDVADGRQHVLARRTFASGYWRLAWSPDGRTLATVAGSADAAGRNMQVLAIDVNDGSQRIVTSEPWAYIGQLAWVAGGPGLLMVATREVPRADQIWFLSYPSGVARRVTDEADNYRGLSVDETTTTLVTTQLRARRSIWVVQDLAPARRVPATRESSSAREIASGSGRVSWTPANDLVFSSTASGTLNVWRVAADGSRPRQLTRVGLNGDPAVSPDGQVIVFESNRGDGTHLWRMSSDGGDPRQLTAGTGEAQPRISPDGRSVIYNAVADQSLWKMPLEGGSPSRLANGPISEAAFSVDGRWIAYNVRDPEPPRRWSIVVMPATGGAPVKRFTRPPGEIRSFELHWSADGAITFETTEEGVSNIWSQPLSGGPPRRITDFKSDYIYSFAWSNDGRHLAALRGKYDADIVRYSLAR